MAGAGLSWMKLAAGFRLWVSINDASVAYM